MKWGLISDIHSNAPALQAVLEDLKLHDIDGILCAGDIVGYYPFPNETIDMMKSVNATSIQGNHDRSVLRVDSSKMNPQAADAVLWTASTLTDDSRRYLQSLSMTKTLHSDDVSISIHHGSPRDPLEYVYEERASEDLLRLADCSILMLGHTHIPYAKKFNNGMVVNPGSVGQPRDGDPRASYSILDTEKKTIDNYRIDYDLDLLERRFRLTKLPNWLIERLRRGI